MTHIMDPISAQAFEAKYRTAPDPWNFSSSPYEQGRYKALLLALSRSSYGIAFEPGCSVGELTAQLASRCREVIAVDLAPSAIEAARRRCAQLTNVSLQVATRADFVPSVALDLVVFSEIGYYFDVPALRSYARSLAGTLQAGGEFVAVHWLGHSVDHVLHGDVVHEQLLDCLPLRWRHGSRHPGFRIECWGCP